LLVQQLKKFLFVQESANHCDWRVRVATYFRETVR